MPPVCNRTKTTQLEGLEGLERRPVGRSYWVGEYGCTVEGQQYGHRVAGRYASLTDMYELF